MLRIRYLYSPPPVPSATKPVRAAASSIDSVSKHLERVGKSLDDYAIRRELLTSSARLSELVCEVVR